MASEREGEHVQDGFAMMSVRPGGERVGDGAGLLRGDGQLVGQR